MQKDIDVSKIKEFFVDGENGDDFGFVNPETGPDQVMEAWNNLVTDLRNIAASAVEKIKAINAFGNVEVQLRLAESAGKVVEILNEHIEASKKVIAEYIAKSAISYGKVGAAAEAGADIGGAVAAGMEAGVSSATGGSSGGGSSSSGAQPGDSLVIDKDSVMTAEQRIDAISKGEIPRSWSEMNDHKQFTVKK